MKAVPRTEIGGTAWDNTVLASDDGWFWHMRLYSEFLIELGAERGARDLSFALVDDSRLVAVCPVYLDECEGVRQFGCNFEPIPFPALIRDVQPALRERALEFYLKELERLASEHGSPYVRMKVPALAAAHVGRGGLPAFNPIARLGFLDLPFATQVIELRRSEEELWADVRKGHRSDIRRAEKVCRTLAWDKDTVTPEIFKAYQELHRKDAGRVTRSQRSFDLMLEWIRTGYAVLFEARNGEQPLAFALVVLFGNGAYYGSGCKDPGVREVNPAHALHWNIIRWLKEHGFHLYDIGLQRFGPQWFHVPSEKELAIARFMRGFGGETIPLHTAEYFYSPEFRTRCLRERCERLISRLSGS